MGYDGVKTFWVELTVKFRGVIWGDGEPDVETVYADRAEADRGKWNLLTPLYRLPDGREVAELPPGSIYAAGGDYRPGPDGQAIVAVCPDGTHWRIDGRCTNCAKPDDNEHFCWLRTGDPKGPTFTVSRGCVGGGSIQTDKYHGMLQNGAFSSG